MQAIKNKEISIKPFKLNEIEVDTVTVFRNNLNSIAMRLNFLEVHTYYITKFVLLLVSSICSPVVSGIYNKLTRPRNMQLVYAVLNSSRRNDCRVGEIAILQT